jgi:hypothetical protein
MKLRERLDRLPPKATIILMFAFILVCVVANLIYSVTRPSCPCAEKKNIFKAVTQEMQKSAPNQSGPVSYKELEERARKAKALLESKRPLSHSDSVFIIQTGELLNPKTPHK